MSDLNLQHDDYEINTAVRTKDEDGDLNGMIYTLYGEKEWNYSYDIEQEYTYISDFESVEDGWIETENEEGSNKLLMFRDSFGNTLIPLIANQFKNAYFSKEVPYGLESLIEQYNPDTVVFEKVERNIREYITMPPIISAPGTEVSDKVSSEKSTTTIVVESSEYDSEYYKISGQIEESFVSENTDIVVQIDDDYYEAYHIDDCGYELYIKKDDIVTDSIEVSVIVNDGDTYCAIQTETLEVGGIE